MPEANAAFQFSCTVWTNKLMLSSSPHSSAWHGYPSTGTITITPSDKVVLTIALHPRREMALSEIEGFTCELLMSKRQMTNRLRSWLIVVMAIGVVLATIAACYMSQGKPALLNWDYVIDQALKCIAVMAIFFVVGLLFMLPSFADVDTILLFTLKFRNGYQWEFGVVKEQGEQIKTALTEYGIRVLPNDSQTDADYPPSF